MQPGYDLRVRLFESDGLSPLTEEVIAHATLSSGYLTFRKPLHFSTPISREQLASAVLRLRFVPVDGFSASQPYIVVSAVELEGTYESSTSIGLNIQTQLGAILTKVLLGSASLQATTEFITDGITPPVGVAQLSVSSSALAVGLFSTDQSLSLVPDGDLSSNNVIANSGLSLWDKVDEGPSTPDDDLSYIQPETTANAFVFFSLTDPPSNLGSLISLRAVVRVRLISPAQAYRYFRLDITENDGSPDYTAIVELELRTSLGGAQAAVGGTATAASQFSGTYAASMAFDGSLSTLWITSLYQHVPTWIQYDMGVGNDITVVQYAITAQDGGATRAPRTFQLWGSGNGSDWVTLDTRINESGWTSGQQRTYTIP